MKPILKNKIYLDNVKATKLLKSLYTAKKCSGKHGIDHENVTMQKAMDIYMNIAEEKNDYVVNTMLNLCLNMNKPEKISLIWNDIENMICKDVIMYPSLIKWCIKTNNFEKGQQIYNNYLKNTKHKDDIFIQCSLINFYGHFGYVQIAKQIFDKIPDGIKNTVIFNTMLTCFSNNNYPLECLNLYQQFEHLHDDTSHLLAIKQCINKKYGNNKQKGLEIIKKSINYEFNNHSNDLLNIIIGFYGRFGEIEKAKSIFKHLSMTNKLDKVTINSMIKMFVDNNQNKKALKLYDECNERDMFIDDVSHILVIQACINLNYKHKGYKIINMINDKKSMKLQGALLKFYSHFKELKKCQEIFDEISVKNVVHINCMIQAYVDNDCYENGLMLFDDYYSLIENNTVSHVLALETCIKSNNFEKGIEIQSKIKESKHLNNNIMLNTQQIHFYGHFGETKMAQNIFESISENSKDVVCVSAMMKCMINNHYTKNTLDLYDKYEYLHNDVTHLLAIKACSKLGNQQKGEEIINKIKMNKANWSNELRITIVDFYGHFAYNQNALNVFNSIPDNDKELDSINAMMNVYCNCNKNIECIQLFKSIHNQTFKKLKPDVISYNIAIKACTQGSFIQIGKEIHEELNKKDPTENQWILSEKSIVISLINMYSEFGMLDICMDIFNEYGKFKELEIWNTMIHAVVKNGDIKHVKNLYDGIKNEQLLDNLSCNTYSIMINACSHCGDDKFAENIWNNDINDNKIKYDCYVITCLVDCYSRKGLFKKGLEIINKYENENKDKNKAMWMSLLSGCIKYKNIEMTKIVYNEFVKRFKYNKSYMFAANTLMSNQIH